MPIKLENIEGLEEKQKTRLREIATDLDSQLEGEPVLRAIGYAFEYQLPQDVSQNEAMLQSLLEGVSKLGPYIQVYAAKKDPQKLRLESSGSTGFCGDGKGPSLKIVRT